MYEGTEHRKNPEVHAISQAASDAAKVVTDAAAVALKAIADANHHKDLDHDVLIEIKTIVSTNGEKLAEFMVDTRKRLDGHDRDIKFTNQIIYGAMGAFVFIEFMLKVVKP